MTRRPEALLRLDAFVGEWTVGVEPAPGRTGRCTFSWALDGTFLVQRTTAPIPAAPDSMAIICAAPDGEGYTQHYYDSRGVVRLYAMSFADGVWRLERGAPDFSPLSFHQRFTATFGDGGDVIRGTWEISHDEGASWEDDFTLVYRRVPPTGFEPVPSP